jgi:hypothetical protein
MIRPMLIVGALIGASTSVASAQSLRSTQGPARDRDRLLATRPPYPSGMADDVHRPGFNGRRWESRGSIGGQPKQYPLSWGTPGPAAYGAREDDFSIVFARVGNTVVTINPWEAIPEAGYQRLERARNEWLKERGYIGGVRTFTNPAYRSTAKPVANAIDPATIQPRAIIELPEDMPRFKKRQDVAAPADRNPASEIASESARDSREHRAVIVARTKDRAIADRRVAATTTEDPARCVIRVRTTGENAAAGNPSASTEGQTAIQPQRDEDSDNTAQSSAATAAPRSEETSAS